MIPTTPPVQKEQKMSYEPRAYTSEAGEPVVVLVVQGQYEVARLVEALEATVGTAHEGAAIREQLQGTPAGIQTLRLLREVTHAN